MSGAERAGRIDGATGPAAWTAWATPQVWLDERGRLCPAPVIALGRAAAQAAEGSLIAVLTTDPAADSDVPAWARLRGATYLGAVAAPDSESGVAHLVRTTATSRTLGVNHVGVSVSDLDSARGFWCGAMGFVEIGGWTWPVGTAPSDAALGLQDTSASVALLRAGSMHLELFAFHSPTPQARDPRAVRRSGITHLALTVTDVDGVVARLAAGGVPVIAPPDGDAPRSAWVSDPDGNLVELLSHDATGGYGVAGLVVDARPSPGPDDPAPTPPARPDVLGVHHVGLGVDAGRDDASRWAAAVDTTGAAAAPWPPRHLPLDEAAGGPLAHRCSPGLLLDAGNVRLELVDSEPAEPRRTCDLGYNHLCLDVEGIARWPERLGPDDIAWHHDAVESSGGIAAVRYGRERGGIVVELLENRTSRALLWCGHLPGLPATSPV